MDTLCSSGTVVPVSPSLLQRLGDPDHQHGIAGFAHSVGHHERPGPLLLPCDCLRVKEDMCTAGYQVQRHRQCLSPFVSLCLTRLYQSL